MKNIIIREPKIEDKAHFLQAMQHSQLLHHPWVKSPLTTIEYDDYLLRAQQPNQKSFLVCNQSNDILGVFNINEIVHGCFQNAYLRFYSVANNAGKGYMSAGLKLVLRYAFEEMKLHRLESNIQPENTRSIQLVKKNGFRYEGFSPRYLKINDEWRGHEHWAITAEDYIADSPAVLKKDYVNLVPYDSEWPFQAQKEIDKIKSVFPIGAIVDIQHVGSTAIVGLSAKPIIDIQIATLSLENMQLIAVPILQKLGYEYWASNPDPKRMFFVKGMPPYGDKRTHHVHIFEQDSDHWRNKLLFRDYLRLNPDVAKEYEQLKFKLAQSHLYDRERYTDEKLYFVNKVLQLAKNNLNKSKIDFRPISIADIPLMLQWFNTPHVQTFYSLRSWTEDEVLAKLTPYISGDKPVSGYMIFFDENPIGYLQSYKVSDYPWPNQNLPEEIVKNAIGMDLFIGNEDLLGKGLGQQIIQAFIENYISPQYQYCIVDPDIRNISAIRCYVKLKFKVHQVIDTKDALNRPTKLHLMVLKCTD